MSDYLIIKIKTIRISVNRMKMARKIERIVRKLFVFVCSDWGMLQAWPYSYSMLFRVVRVLCILLLMHVQSLYVTSRSSASIDSSRFI